MADIEIHVTRYCPYCHLALDLLRRKGVSFREIDVTGDSEARRLLLERTGRRTVPQIFINGAAVCGYDDIAALDRAGRLDALLAEQPRPT